jgi:hypothetical protein
MASATLNEGSGFQVAPLLALASAAEVNGVADPPAANLNKFLYAMHYFSPLGPTRGADCFSSIPSRQWFMNEIRSRGITFSSAAFFAQLCCNICSARRFSAASRYSGATLVGSTSF